MPIHWFERSQQTEPQVYSILKPMNNMPLFFDRIIFVRQDKLVFSNLCLPIHLQSGSWESYAFLWHTALQYRADLQKEHNCVWASPQTKHTFLVLSASTLLRCKESGYTSTLECICWYSSKFNHSCWISSGAERMQRPWTVIRIRSSSDTPHSATVRWYAF